MAEYARAHDIGLILTAHTEDDQAETLLMRLARGSGLDGLGAMAPIAPLQDGESLLIARPLLDVPKTRLQASLRRRGIGWIEDPSNASPVFERVRLRAARAALEGLGLTPGMLGLSARRLRQARSALDRWVADVLDPAAGMVEVHACGFFSIDRSRLACVARRDHRPRADPRHRRGGRSRRAGAARRCGGDPGRPVLPREPIGAWTLARARARGHARAPADRARARPRRAARPRARTGRSRHLGWPLPRLGGTVDRPPRPGARARRRWRSRAAQPHRCSGGPARGFPARRGLVLARRAVAGRPAARIPARAPTSSTSTATFLPLASRSGAAP